MEKNIKLYGVLKIGRRNRCKRRKPFSLVGFMVKTSLLLLAFISTCFGDCSMHGIRENGKCRCFGVYSPDTDCATAPCPSSSLGEGAVRAVAPALHDAEIYFNDNCVNDSRRSLLAVPQLKGCRAMLMSIRDILNVWGPGLCAVHTKSLPKTFRESFCPNKEACDPVGELLVEARNAYTLIGASLDQVRLFRKTVPKDFDKDLAARRRIAAILREANWTEVLALASGAKNSFVSCASHRGNLCNGSFAKVELSKNDRKTFCGKPSERLYPLSGWLAWSAVSKSKDRSKAMQDAADYFTAMDSKTRKAAALSVDDITSRVPVKDLPELPRRLAVAQAHAVVQRIDELIKHTGLGGCPRIGALRNLDSVVNSRRTRSELASAVTKGEIGVQRYASDVDHQENIRDNKAENAKRSEGSNGKKCDVDVGRLLSEEGVNHFHKVRIQSRILATVAAAMAEYPEFSLPIPGALRARIPWLECAILRKSGASDIKWCDELEKNTANNGKTNGGPFGNANFLDALCSAAPEAVSCRSPFHGHDNSIDSSRPPSELEESNARAKSLRILGATAQKRRHRAKENKDLEDKKAKLAKSEKAAHAAQNKADRAQKSANRKAAEEDDAESNARTEKEINNVKKKMDVRRAAQKKANIARDEADRLQKKVQPANDAAKRAEADAAPVESAPTNNTAEGDSLNKTGEKLSPKERRRAAKEAHKQFLQLKKQSRDVPPAVGLQVKTVKKSDLARPKTSK